MIIILYNSKGDPFKILGIHFDTKLVMYDAVVIVAVESGARLKMLLRARPFYCQSDLVCLYKCHVLLFIESGTPAYYHASSVILKLLDDVQTGFLESAGISKVDAIMNFNLAPFKCAP